MEVYLEYAFKAILSLGVAMMIFILKDFKASLQKLTESLSAVTLSLNSLLIKDENKAEKLSELKSVVERLQTEVDVLRDKFNDSHIKHSHDILELKHKLNK